MDYLLTGLGNPGPRYACTRHNIGARALVKFAMRLRAWPPDKHDHGRLIQVATGGKQLGLFWGQSYMNESGQDLKAVIAEHQLSAERVMVLHDEIDFPLGKLRAKQGGGAGGHNGLKSIVEEVGSRDFWRLRIGIGRPDSTEGDLVAAYVLGRFQPAEKAELLASSALQELDNWLAGV